MFVHRSEVRAWSELSTREIVTNILVVCTIATAFVVVATVNGFQYFEIGVAGFVLIGAVSVSRNAIGELNRRRRRGQETESHNNNDHH